jgi:flagellar hook-length control protein FliK
MRVSTESLNEVKQDAEHRADEQKTSDRFSQILKSKNEKSQEKQDDTKKQDGPKGDGDNVQQKSQAAALNPLSMNPPVGDALAVRFSQQSAAADGGRIARPGASAASQIDKLTTEISQQIDLVKQGGKTEGINITFDSKTLEGLQVQIRQQDGGMAIRFITQSDNVSNLLSRNAGQLQEALTSKGVKIQNIVISNTHRSPVMQRNGNAGV